MKECDQYEWWYTTTWLCKELKPKYLSNHFKCERLLSCFVSWISCLKMFTRYRRQWERTCRRPLEELKKERPMINENPPAKASESARNNATVVKGKYANERKWYRHQLPTQTKHYGDERQGGEGKKVITTVVTNNYHRSRHEWNSRPVRGVRIRNEIQTLKRNPNFKAMENPSRVWENEQSTKDQSLRQKEKHPGPTKEKAL